jgi:hypothetical protein
MESSGPLMCDDAAREAEEYLAEDISMRRLSRSGIRTEGREVSAMRAVSRTGQSGRDTTEPR